MTMHRKLQVEACGHRRCLIKQREQLSYHSQLQIAGFYEATGALDTQPTLLHPRRSRFAPQLSMNVGPRPERRRVSGCPRVVKRVL